jgi:thymidylate kinase
MNKFFVFEGVDCSGKSTFAKLLAEKIGGEYYYTPPEQVQSLRKFADSFSDYARGLYYYWGSVVASEDIKEKVKSIPIVADGYIYRTIAYHLAITGEELLIPKKILVPDKIFYISSSFEEISNRISKRFEIIPHEQIGLLKKVDLEYKKIFSEMGNVVFIENSGKSFGEVFQEIINKV